MGFELVEKDLIRVHRRAGQDSEILEAHGVAIGLEVADEIYELCINVGAGAGVSGLRVYDAWRRVSEARERKEGLTYWTLVVSSSWSLHQPSRRLRTKGAGQAEVVVAANARRYSPADGERT